MLVGMIFAGWVYAAIPGISPQMIEQFKKLTFVSAKSSGRPVWGGSKYYSGSRSGPKIRAGQSREQIRIIAKIEFFNSESNLDESAFYFNDQVREDKQPLKKFGLDIFDPSKASFVQVDSMPIPQGYILGVEIFKFIYFF